MSFLSLRPSPYSFLMRGAGQVSVSRSAFSMISNTDPGFAHVDDGLMWENATGMATATTNLTALPGSQWQWTHVSTLFNMRDLVPWDGVSALPDTSDTADIDWWGSASGGTEEAPWKNSLDRQIDLMNTINPGGSMILTLFQLPWWMLGRLLSNGTTELLTAENQYNNDSDFGRCRTDRLSYALDLIEQIVTRYAVPANNPSGVAIRHFSPFQEMKGFYRNKDLDPQEWDMDPYAGTAGANADMGGLYYYNQVYDRIQSVASSLGVTLYVGGPYPVIKSMGPSALTADKISDTRHPLHYESLATYHGRAPYGYYRKQEQNALTAFMAGANGYDFICATTRLENRGSSVGEAFLNGWTDYEVQRVKYGDIMRGHTYDGMPAGTDVIFMEVYPSSSVDTRSAQYRASLIASGMASMADAGIRVPFFWSPFGNSQGDEPAAGLVTNTDTVDGGTVQPTHGVYDAFGTHFNRGQYIYDVSVMGSPRVRARANRDSALVWNESGITQSVQVEGQTVVLTPHGYSVVSLTDLLTSQIAGTLTFPGSFTHTGNCIIQLTVTTRPPATNCRISFREGGGEWWEIRITPSQLQLVEYDGSFATVGFAAIADGDMVTVIANGTSIQMYINYILAIDETVETARDTATVGNIKTLASATIDDLIALPLVA